MYWYRRIKDLREDLDLSRPELASKLNISERTLSRYETGESEPTISILIKLSIIFNVSLDYICCIKDDPTIYEESTKEKLSAALDQLQHLLKELK